MSVAARVDKLEGALSPAEATILWLHEAHAFVTLEAYGAWLATQDVSAAPLERVPDLARRGALELLKGQPREVILTGSRQTRRDALFLVELVLLVNTEARETLRTEGLRFAAFHWMLRAFLAELNARLESAGSRRAGSRLEDLAELGGAIRMVLVRLRVEGEARTELERRYLGGQSVLFPADAEDWERLVVSLETLAEMGEGALAEHGWTRRRRRTTEPAAALSASDTRAAVEARVRYVVDLARAHALRALGHEEAAMAIVGRRLVAEAST
jgi:hypothetical protein